jgi:hypothetical protein
MAIFLQIHVDSPQLTPPCFVADRVLVTRPAMSRQRKKSYACMRVFNETYVIISLYRKLLSEPNG